MRAGELLLASLVLVSSFMYESTRAQSLSPSTVSDSAPCLSYPCKNGASCFNRGQDYFCTCYHPFSGKNCEIDLSATSPKPSRSSTTSYCSHSPCQNGGSCIDPGDASGYRCDCLVGFEGTDCQYLVTTSSPKSSRSPLTSYCSLHTPCQNGGSCTDDAKRRDYQCKCLLGYEGKDCQHLVSATSPKSSTSSTTSYCSLHTPCLHSGSCTDTADGSGYRCDCLVGFEGTDCQYLMRTRSPKSSTSPLTSYCSLHTPCQNGGSCTDDAKGSDYQCKCPLGYEGKDCQHLVQQPEETKEIVLTDDRCERKVSVGIPQVKYMATLSCEEGTILIKSVAYGSGAHWNAWIDQIGKMCDHQTQCNVAAKDDMLDDPFRRVYKRLIIVYECGTH